MTITPEHTLTRSEVRQILQKRAETIDPTEEIRDWTIEELAEEAQNPSYYEHKEDYLRAIAFHPKGNHILIQLALAMNDDLPKDVVDFLIRVSPYASVIQTLMVTQPLDSIMSDRAKEAVESIHLLSERR